MKHFRSIHDVESPEALVQKAIAMKENPMAQVQLGQGKTIGLVFFNASLRTRLSSQKAALNLGLSPIVMNIGSDGWQLEFEDGAVMNGGKAEHIKEAAPVIAQYCDIIGIRSFPGLKNRDEDYADNILNSFAQYCGKPVVSLESAIRHPLQSLADLITIEEHKTKARPKVVLTWAPHPRALPQAVGNSFIEWMKHADVDLTVTHPEGYELAPEFVDGVSIEYDQKKAFEGADFVYAKNWSSYTSYGQILSEDPSWQVTADKMAVTDNGKFMHCLPVRRNVIVADAVIDSPNSLVIQQANNRTFAAQSVFEEILQGMG